MKLLRRTLALTDAAAALDAAPAAAFAVDADSIDPAVFGLTSYAAPTSVAPRIDRRTAVQVPAVKRAHDLIAGVLGALPWDTFTADRRPVDNALLAQPEANVPRSVTMTRLLGISSMTGSHGGKSPPADTTPTP